MKKTIIWKGLYYRSLEYCEINGSEKGIDVTSVIVGIHEDRKYKIDYSIKANANWELLSCSITRRLDGTMDMQTFHHHGQGNWTRDQEPLEEYTGCTDIDISLTPFTNSLPINRLKLRRDQVRDIKVLYIDVLNRTTTPNTQRYSRLSEFEYRYQNVPNDFEAVITVDQQGIVKDYPGLFVQLNG
jgi:uncharacterized protein